MEDSSSTQLRLPLVLLAAVVQGWMLYGLHHSIQAHHWPATDQAWLIALYATAVYIPVTLQLLAEYRRAAALWWLVTALAIAYCYFGWHEGASVAVGATGQYRNPIEYFPFALLLTVLWLMALPFAQSRLASGHWTIEYRALFSNAWRNQLALAEAALFTGLFWLLLFLWQTLFHLLKFDYFRELFQEPIFAYPVTSLVFGSALHLIGSIEELTSAVLAQLLNVLKWLGLLAGILLACFTIALLFHLPDLVFTGQKAIGAAWLLWLVAVMVLLLNAAYRDGTNGLPYPKWIAQSQSAVVPLMVIVSLTAFYSLLMRTRHYGLTVERVWAWVVAGAALLYSAGYSLSAFARGPWLAGIARVNVIVALALIAVICAALTPLLSPYRLAADSQYRLILAQGPEVPQNGVPRDGVLTAGSLYGGTTPLQYLRFDSGRYGRERLEELTRLETGPQAARIRQLAREQLARKERWDVVVPHPDNRAVVDKLRVFPAGRTLDQDLTDLLIADLQSPASGLADERLQDDAVAGIFVDLNGDHVEDFVFLIACRGLVYEKRAGRWVFAGHAACQSGGNLDLIGELSKGDFAATAPLWNDLSIGGRTFRITAAVPSAVARSR